MDLTLVQYILLGMTDAAGGLMFMALQDAGSYPQCSDGRPCRGSGLCRVP